VLPETLQPLLLSLAISPSMVVLLCKQLSLLPVLLVLILLERRTLSLALLVTQALIAPPSLLPLASALLVRLVPWVKLHAQTLQVIVELASSSTLKLTDVNVHLDTVLPMASVFARSAL
jgi:hypothetical protein